MERSLLLIPVAIVEATSPIVSGILIHYGRRRGHWGSHLSVFSTPVLKHAIQSSFECLVLDRPVGDTQPIVHLIVSSQVFARHITSSPHHQICAVIVAVIPPRWKVIGIPAPRRVCSTALIPSNLVFMSVVPFVDGSANPLEVVQSPFRRAHPFTWQAFSPLDDT